MNDIIILGIFIVGGLAIGYTFGYLWKRCPEKC